MQQIGVVIDANFFSESEKYVKLALPSVFMALLSGQERTYVLNGN